MDPSGIMVIPRGDRQTHQRDHKKIEILKQIDRDLGRQRTVVYGIANSVESTKAAINVFEISLKVFDSAEGRTEEESYVTHCQLKGIFESLQCMFECFQDSMVCQSETLKTTFTTLNETILEALDLIRLENNQDDYTLEKTETTDDDSTYIDKVKVVQLYIDRNLLYEENSQLKYEIKSINEEKCSLEKQMTQTQQEIEQLKQEIKRLNVEIHQQKTQSHHEFEQLKQGNNSLITENDKQMKQKQNEIEHLKQEIERLNIEKDQEVSHAQHEIELLKRDNKSLQIEKEEHITHAQKELEQFKFSYEQLNVQNKKTIEKKQLETEHLMQEIYRLNEDRDQQTKIFAELSNKHIESEKAVAEMNDQINNLQSECETLRIENLRLCQAEGYKEVQIHFEGKGELIFNIVDELKTTLVQHMGILRRELKFILCPSVNDVDPDIPLMVLCINVSRIGTDVQRTLHHLKVTNPMLTKLIVTSKKRLLIGSTDRTSNRVALLLLHHKDVHALPSQASDRVLTGVDFQSLGGIFDLAFLADKGLYKCDMNSKAADGIINFIKARSY